MKRNYHELPALIRLVADLRGSRKFPSDVRVACQALENYDIRGYRDFVRQEHHSLIPREELMQIFLEALQLSKSTGIGVSTFGGQSIEEFAEKGFPFPPLWF